MLSVFPVITRDRRILKGTDDLGDLVFFFVSHLSKWRRNNRKICAIVKSPEFGIINRQFSIDFQIPVFSINTNLQLGMQNW